MDKKTIENLKQFRNVTKLLISTEKKYKENIDKFTKKDNNSKITSYIVPIIIDVSSNKEIIFSDKLSSEYVMAGNETCSIYYLKKKKFYYKDSQTIRYQSSFRF